MTAVDLANHRRGNYAAVGRALVLILAVIATYGNSLHVPFVYDDVAAIVENASIRHGAPEIWYPPSGTTVAGRPLTNATLALNYALSGDRTFSYHAFNLVIHALAALTLMAVVRSALTASRLRPRFGSDATSVAFLTAFAWAVHPLHTEAVTYVVQRAESLVSLFYLLTLLAVGRSVGAGEAGRNARAWSWAAIAIVACALGMMTKEVMVTAPILAVWYDRVFFAGSFRELARKRWRLYAGLALTWIVLIVVTRASGDRAGTAGFDAGVRPLDYAAVQVGAIAHYFRLMAWPHPLVFDYGPFSSVVWLSELLPALGLALLIGVGLWAARRVPAVAFAGGGCLLVLAPTSSVLPIVTEPIAEHRVYLASALLVALAVAVLYRLLRGAASAPLLTLGLAFGALAAAHNVTYRSERALWSATVAAAPANPRAHYCLALTLLRDEQPAGAEAELRKAIELEPRYIAARQRLAELLGDTGRVDEAWKAYTAILAFRPEDFVARSSLGLLAFQRGDYRTAAEYLSRAVQERPASAVAQNNLGGVLYELGDFTAAAQHEATALRLDPSYAEAAYNLGNALARLGRPAEARTYYERALRLRPEYPEAQANLAAILRQTGDRAGAIKHFRAALKLRPGFEFARQNLLELGVAE